MSHEYELTFLDINKNSLRSLLLTKGFLLIQSEILMKRQTFHLPKNHPEHETKWARIRDEGTKLTATIKWYTKNDHSALSIEDVHEEEIILNTFEEGEKWLTQKGFTPTAYQENLREIWISGEDSKIELAIDTWPGLNPYLEIEASSKRGVENTAQSLGFNLNEGIIGGVELIYEKELNIAPKTLKPLKEITFNSPPQSG